MAFVDDLALILDLLILITAVIFYTGALVWFEVGRKDLVRANSHLREGAVLLGLLGGVIGLIALWGEFFWPLPGAYNLFFFDPLLMLSLLLVAFAIAVWNRLPTHLVGMLGAIIGVGILFYGIRGYEISLTKDPFETLLMYLGFGALAIGSYPVTLFLDWFVIGPTVPGEDPLPSSPTPDYPTLWMVLLGLFMAIVILAGVAAVEYGISAAWAHLASPP
jgi:putative membrane protein